MKMLFVERRLIHRFEGGPASRPVIAGRQFMSDLTAGIDGKDLIDDALRVPRNVAVAGWRGLNQGLPILISAINGFRDKYYLENRDHQEWAGSRATIDRFRSHFHNKRYLSAVGTLAIEGIDGFTDDLGHLTIGAPKTVIKPA